MSTSFSPNGNGTHVHFPELDLSAEAKESDSAAGLRAKGQIRAHGVIPIELNERIKTLARRRGVTADVVVGEFIIKGSADLDRFEAERAAAELREKFGDNWLEILRQASPGEK